MLAIEVYYSNFIIILQVYENEDKWVNYDEEETEVGVELADMVFEKLVTEIVKDLNVTMKNRKGTSYFQGDC